MLRLNCVPSLGRQVPARPRLAIAPARNQRRAEVTIYKHLSPLRGQLLAT